ncbi:MAG: hypothetical protein RLY14_3358 [Planctomycetota bacterium]|jgi:uncharacterized SAM-binding protein YcdF (DUF218 family)
MLNHVADGGSLDTKRLWQRLILKSVVAIASIPLVMTIGTWIASGKTAAEKVATALVLPTGLMWLALLGLVLFCLFAKSFRLASVAALLWLLFTLCSSPVLPGYLVRRLQSDVIEVDPNQVESFDALVVLGGGTSQTPGGRSMVSSAGERVILAAKMFHRGKSSYLITTGESIAAISSSSKNGAQQTTEIWTDLQVPAPAIVRLGGRTTSEEMVEVRKWVLDHPEVKRVGLITSAWHMPRAMRLAARQGLDLVPVPADFRSGELPDHLVEFLPNGGSLGEMDLVIKEYLARLVGR